MSSIDTMFNDVIDPIDDWMIIIKVSLPKSSDKTSIQEHPMDIQPSKKCKQNIISNLSKENIELHDYMNMSKKRTNIIFEELILRTWHPKFNRLCQCIDTQLLYNDELHQ
jgi:hypothetical protein